MDYSPYQNDCFLFPLNHLKTRKTRLEVSVAFSNLVRVAYFILEILRTGSWSQEITGFN